MSDRQYFTDVAVASLEYVGDDDVIVDADDFNPSEAETITLDSPWNDFFETDEYVQFDATVAQPIVQPYIYNGELHTFKKDEDELKRAQAQLDNLAWTMGHPPEDRITSSKQIRGFWKEPQWSDGQKARLNIPATDAEAVRFAVTNDEVSPGFSGRLDWVDDADHDAVQRDMAYDHVASVESGRCPPEKGCGLHTDGMDSEGTGSHHGHVFQDAVQTQATEEPTEPEESMEWDEGDFVKFSKDGEDHHGKVAYVDAERALVKRYDPDEETFTDEATTVPTSGLREWVGPFVDECPGDTCSCGCHGSTESFSDAPDGIHVDDGDWYGIAPSETADDEPKYELNNCNDVKDAYNLRNNGDYDVDTSTLVERIERAATSHDCPPEQKPWVDSAELLAHFIAKHD